MDNETKNFGTYWKIVGEDLVAGLDANTKLTQVTRNSDLVGAFAEETVNTITARTMAPLRRSTGSIISTDDIDGSELKQVDSIFWNPAPVPALFDVGNFGLVPNRSVVGCLEVKRSAYNDVGQNMRSTLDWCEDRTLGALVPDGLGQYQADPDWTALGVICVKLNNQTLDTQLRQLINKGRAVVLMEQNDDDSLRVNVSHVLHFTMFLGSLRQRAPRLAQAYGASPSAIAGFLNETAPGPLKRSLEP